MADSDSGTHVTDISEVTSQEDADLKREEKYRPITDAIISMPPIRSMSQGSLKSMASSESPKESLSPTMGHRKETIRASIRTLSTVSPKITEHARRGSDNEASTSRPISGNRNKHLTAAYVHSTPRSYRKLNGIPPRRNPPVTRQRSFPGSKISGYAKSGRGRRSASFNSKIRAARSFESLHSSELRTAYDFANHPSPRRKSRQRQIELDELQFVDQEEDEEYDFDDSSWMPTGIYAAFVITMWSAILKLIDGIERNGPEVCSSSEEVRLWICACSLTVFHGLAEAVAKRKELFKVIFSMVCVFAYMVITHTQPLSCRLGVAKVTETSKWQSAICFFCSALLGAVVYQEIKTDHTRRRQVKTPKRKRRRKDEDKHDYDSDELNDFKLPPPPQPSIV